MLYPVGSYFGIEHASAAGHRARVRYTECLQTAINQLAGQGKKTRILVEAAPSYRDTDALTAADADKVRRVLNAAVTSADAARASAVAGSGAEVHR